MSLNLKNFILDEGIKSSHAVKFIDYQDNFHDDVQEDLISALSKAWKKSVDHCKNEKPDSEKAEDMVLKNPKAFLGVDFSTKEMPVGGGRFPKPKITSLSVRISHAFSVDSRRVFIRQFLNDAQDIFERIVHKNEDAFSIKFASGKHKSLFHVVRSDDLTVKIQFRTYDKNSDKNSKEIIKTIFMVGVDHGKESSKTKNYDRVFFLDYTR